MKETTILDDQWDYTLYIWKERIHRRTGKVLDANWQVFGEYDNAEEGQKDIDDYRARYPDSKFRFVRDYREILLQDYVDHGAPTLVPALIKK